MMRALKEYNEMVMSSMIVPYLWFYWSDITEYVKSKFKKNEEES